MYKTYKQHITDMEKWTETSLLIVDDSDLVRTRIKDLLSENDFKGNVYEAINSRHAYEMFLKYSPEIVLLDIHIRGENGMDLIRRLKMINPHFRLLVLTNYPYEEYRIKCLSLGADYFFNKNDEVGTAIKFCNCLYDDIKSKN